MKKYSFNLQNGSYFASAEITDVQVSIKLYKMIHVELMET